MVLVGQGSVRDSLPVVLGLVALGAFAGILADIAVIVSDSELASDWFGPVFVLLVFMSCGMFAGAFVVLWVLSSAGRIRYYVEGTSVVVCRGRRTIVRKDVSAASAIGVNGWINTRRGLFVVGPRWPFKSGLPHVFLEQPTTGRFVEDYELPDVFIWGRDGADAFRQALFAELKKAGIDQAAFAT